MTPAGSDITAPSEVIQFLVEAARQTGEADYYGGKREWTRYAECMLLDAAEDARSATTTWPVSMHNVSLGGVAFWSKRALRPGAVIRVRQFTADDTGEWMTFRVAYCITGIRGFLVGAALLDRRPA